VPGYRRGVTVRHVVLLRGINVGGRNKVAMGDLRSLLTEAGFADVATYIQSGNVLLTTPAREELEAEIEALLAQRLGMSLVVVVRTADQVRSVLAGAPQGFGAHPETYLSDVVFLKAPLTGEDALGVVSLREGVDSAWAGDGVLYFQRVSARRSRSRLSTLVSKPEYQSMTIRNWATTTRLVELAA
jgi:uncharacterized protein (DUF1697 family)